MDFGHELPENGHALLHLMPERLDILRFPGMALSQHIVQERLQFIQTVGIPGIGGGTGVKLLPQRPDMDALLPGQHGKEFFSSCLFPGGFGFVSLHIVGKSVSGIDLHKVVDKEHFHRVERIDLFHGKLSEQQGHHGYMP